MLKRQAEALLHALKQLHPELVMIVMPRKSLEHWYVAVIAGSVDY